LRCARVHYKQAVKRKAKERTRKKKEIRVEVCTGTLQESSQT